MLLDHVVSTARGLVGRKLIRLRRRILVRLQHRLRRTRLPHRLNEALPLLAQDALHAADRIAGPMQQMLDAAHEIDIIRTIEAAPAATFQGFDLRKALLPKAQHMLR